MVTDREPVVTAAAGWGEVKGYVQRHASGGLVSACRTPEGWRFCAWAPPDMPDASFWDWHAAACDRVTRPAGDATPQRAACLGVCPSAAEARALVERATLHAKTV